MSDYLNLTRRLDLLEHASIETNLHMRRLKKEMNDLFELLQLINNKIDLLKGEENEQISQRN